MESLRFCPSCEKPLPQDGPDGLCPACMMLAGFQTGSSRSSNSSWGNTKPALSAPSIEEIGLFFSHLEILALIGWGGSGAVYKAHQPELDRLVALKILFPSAHPGPVAFAKRFNREAHALARLGHPNIVTVHDYGLAGDFHYLMME